MRKEQKFIAVDPEKCVGCGICEYVCSLEKEKAFNPMKSRIRTVRIHPVINMAMVCRMCEDPACAKACPRDALSKSEDDGVILMDEDKCNGCGWCVGACEFGAITIHPIKKVAITCDLCKGEPKCVDWCPEEALVFTTKEKFAKGAKIATVKKLYKEAFKGKS